MDLLLGDIIERVSGLADRGAHHDLEDLILGEARYPGGGDVLVCNGVGGRPPSTHLFGEDLERALCGRRHDDRLPNRSPGRVAGRGSNR